MANKVAPARLSPLITKQSSQIKGGKKDKGLKAGN